MAEVAELVTSRGIIKGKLTRIVNFVKGFETSTNYQHLKARKSLLDGIFKEFEEVQGKIESADTSSTALKTQAQERENFENQYCNVLADIEIILEQINRPANSLSDVSVHSKLHHINSKLPALPLPKFSGKYSEWLSFYDLFNSVIHEDKNLNDCQKMHYLKASLQGDALSAIESLTISNANYLSAWEILNKRYKNDRLIVQEHVLAIINTANISKSSPTTLRQFINNITVNIEALKVLELPTDQWDALIVPLLTERLDYISKKEWYATLNEEIPKLCQFIEFLEKRYQFLESLENSNKADNSKINNKHNYARNQHSNSAPRINSYVTINKPYCFMCKRANHYIYQCSNFLRLNINDRIKQTDSFKLCQNCFRNNHSTVECKSLNKCRDCNAKHNSLLHLVGQVQGEAPGTSTGETIQVVNCCIGQINTVILSTALVLVKDAKGQFQKCRVLLDVGAQSNFVTKEACLKLGLICKDTNIIVSGLGQTEGKVNAITTAIIKSRLNAFSIEILLLVVTKITDPLPNFTVGLNHINIPNNIQLADPNFYVRGPIDMLLGAGIFWQLMCAGQIKLSRSQPYFQKTHLGWIVGGSLTNSNYLTLSKVQANLSTTDDKRLESQVAKFFDIEENSNTKVLSVEERACEEHFKRFHKRTDNGRFIVKLPFKNNYIELGKSKDIAVKRFYSLERKLSKNTESKLEYLKFMQEYEALGHMEVVAETEINNINSCYLPHHAVYKLASSTTRLRVVFDASCATSNGLSLNDNLLTGPTVQQDLFSILVRFRLVEYVINADIKKMYRQIKIDNQDADYQRIIWREEPNHPLKTYKLLTVTYGTTSAPFLAVRCLHELADQFKSEYPAASKVIREDFYMDDLLTGANSIKEAIQLKEQINNILLSGGFQLRKWVSNNNLIIKQSQENETPLSISLQGDSDNKILGLFWNSQNDTLKYNFSLQIETSKITKRIILATASQLFDPLGLVSPVTIKAKILIQQLWNLKLAWDESVPLDVNTAWRQFVTELSELQNLQFARNVIPQWPGTKNVELHGFCDSSEQAYGAVIYIRTSDNQGNCEVNLLCSKARVAPLRSTTLPRLELAGALLLAQLSHKIKQTWNLKVNAEFFWSESTIILAWLALPSNTWKTYVANRVSEIQALTNVINWNHVRSHDNPADIVSRGAYPKNLIYNDFWHHGPHWLKFSRDQWPQSNFTTGEEAPEKRAKVTLVTNTRVENPLLDTFVKYSSFAKIERLVAYCLRFIFNCKNKNDKKLGALSISEIQAANKNIILLVQKSSYLSDIKELQKNGHVNNKSAIKSLDPYLDDQNLLRVGGRLKNSNLNYDKRFPLILPPKHYISKLIVRGEHERQLHAGPLATLASLRRKYWVISGRNLIRNITRKCVKCFKVNPKTSNQKMGNLPKERLEPLRPFLNSGVDFAGPILIKNVTGRSKTKAYIALFVCFATKAVHLELVGDLTTPSFINAFNRFISRRGHVSDLYCDNAKNFVGAEREFKRFFKSEEFQNQLKSQLNPNYIKFHFIPPRAPHMGGIWESLIKSAKYYLKRILRDACVTYEELYTLITRIEAILNSRPLTPISSDPNDLQALTPGHFLIGEALTAPLEENLTDTQINRLSRWQRIEQLRQHFWKRWTTEYLSQLQTRKKWQHQVDAIKLGALVILKEDNIPPLSWRLGRVTELHPGSDGLTRVVSVKVQNGIIKRAINKLCVLPLD